MHGFSKDDFEKRSKRIHNTVKYAMFGITSLILLIWIGYVVIGMYVFKEIDTNGGVQKTLTDIVRVVKQIDKDSDIRNEKDQH